MTMTMPAGMSVIDVRLDAPDSDTSPYPRSRKRKWHTKVPTGCLKCKERRIKCSEEKPGCRRCQKLGINCPGYKLRVARIFEIQPRTSPSFESDLEKARHDYFVDVGSKQLATFQLNSRVFWTRLAPQLSQQYAAVRHALTALGALHAPLHTMPSTKLQYSPRPRTCPLAMQHLHASMHILGTADPSTLPPEVSLTCCMLYTALQYWLEISSSSYTHTLAAYSILQEKLGPHPRRWTQSRVIPPEFAAIYIPALNHLINHACTFADNFPPVTSGIPVDYQLDFDVEQVVTIISKEGAIDVTDKLLKFILRAGNEGQGSPALKESVRAVFDSLERKFGELRDAGVLCKAYDWTHLQIHLQVARVMYEVLDHENETGFDSCTTLFFSIVAYAKRLLHLDACDRPSAQGNLTTSLGLLPPLFFVATRCRDSIIRQDALRVLHEVGVSERGWTSCQAFALASLVVEQEEALNKIHPQGGTAAQVRQRIRLHDMKVCGTSHTATILYDVLSPSSPSSSECALEPIVRRTYTIKYPSHPVVELDGHTIAIPGKVLRSSGYTGILLLRPPLPCHCVPESLSGRRTSTATSRTGSVSEVGAMNGMVDASPDHVYSNSDSDAMGEVIS